MSLAEASPAEERFPAERRICDTVLTILRIRNLPRQELADGISVLPSTLSRMLNGERRVTAEHVAAIAAFLDVPVGVLYEGPASIIERAQNWKKMKRGDLRLLVNDDSVCAQRTLPTFAPLELVDAGKD